MYRNLYALFDTKQECIVGQPWMTTRDAAAIREFVEMCTNTQLVVGQHPEDFELLFLCSIELETGQIRPRESTSALVTTGQDVMAELKRRNLTDEGKQPIG